MGRGDKSTGAHLEFTRAVLDALPDHIYVKDREGRYLMVNKAGQLERGLASSEEIAGKTVHELFPADIAAHLSAEDQAVVDTGRTIVNRESPTRFPGVPVLPGEERWHITSKVPVRDPAGQVIGVVGINRDISERRRLEQALREREEMFRATFDQAAVGIAVISLELRYVRVNDKLCEILGYAQEELLESGVRAVSPPDTLGEAIEFHNKLAAGEQSGPKQLREKELLRKDGSCVWVAIATSIVRAENGAPRFFVSMFQDVSAARRAEAELRRSEERYRQLAQYDPLTGLANRMLFYDRLKQALALARRERWSAAVMFMDLDRFKQVNDTLGHAAGDALLKGVADRLARTVRAADTVGRLGGDEFAILLAHLTSPADAAVVARKIMQALEAPFDLGEQSSVQAGASIGIALYPQDATEQEALLRQADAAMYRVKQRVRGSYEFFRTPPEAG